MSDTPTDDPLSIALGLVRSPRTPVAVPHATPLELHDWLRAHPGASTVQILAVYGEDDLLAPVERHLTRGDYLLAREHAHVYLAALHQASREGRFGQLVDGTWWTQEDNEHIAETVRVGYLSPGAFLFRTAGKVL